MQIFYIGSVQICLSISLASSLCSVSCLAVVASWFFIELSTLAIVPMMMAKGGGTRPDGAFGYFFAQVLGSGGLLAYVVSSETVVGYLGFLVGSFLKLGIGPFHWWVPKVAVSVGWSALMAILTLQKFAPVVLVMSFVSLGDWVVLLVACLSAVLGSLGGLKEGSVAGIMGWSSISQGGWLVAASASNVWVAVVFFLVYAYQVVFTMALLGGGAAKGLKVGDLSGQGLSLMKRCCASIFLLSMGGIPPTLGFFSKVLVLGEMMSHKSGYWVCAVLVMSSVVSMFFYLRIIFSVAEEGVSSFRTEKYEGKGLSVAAAFVAGVGSIFLFICH